MLHTNHSDVVTVASYYPQKVRCLSLGHAHWLPVAVNEVVARKVNEETV